MTRDIHPAHTLWYEKAAEYWNEALPLGNGRIGAMVFGGAGKERICLNEDTLWTGHPRHYGLYGGEDTWEKARALAHEKKYREAQQLLERDFTSAPTQNYLPLGELTLDFGPADPWGYRRRLDLSTGVHTVEYENRGVFYKRESFVSAPDQVFAMRITANDRAAVSFVLEVSSQLRASVTAGGKEVVLKGQCPDRVIRRGLPQDQAVHVYPEDKAEQGIEFLAAAHVEAEGGKVYASRGTLRVEGADAVTVYFAVRTSFSGWDKSPVLEGRPFERPCRSDLQRAVSRGWKTLLKAHTEDHSALYGRCELDLGGGAEGEKPTDERLLRHMRGREDNALYALLFHYGRYLTIAGSRPGTQATNLQGIWNHRLHPPWNCNYTININTEMNYWPALMTNLAECTLPLHDLVKELAESGRRTAAEYYRAPGFCSHHNTDLWRFSTPVGNGGEGVAVWGIWPMSAGWLLRELIEYRNYTGDLTYLRETLYPLLHGCAEFYAAMLDEDGEGKLVFCPSTSPEHNFLLEDGTRCPIAETTAMTMAIVKDIFTELLRAAETLSCGGALEARVSGMLPRLRGYVLTDTGAVAEWSEKGLASSEEHHRHISHLYGMHPAHHIAHDEPLADAVRQTLAERGDDGTGWSLGWKINQWARLRDGDHAKRLIDMQLRMVESGEEVNFALQGGSYPNLFDAHPPFQIDGNYGACSGIAEMLVQNGKDGPVLLPALPSGWRNGSVRGLRVWGGKTVDIVWKDGAVTESRIF